MRLSQDGSELIGVTDSDLQNGEFTFPSSVTSIGNSAFRELLSLRKVTIPASVTSIGEWAFTESGLTEVDIPSSVTHIGQWAFAGCTGLTKVDIPSSVTHLEKGTFAGCRGLTKVDIPSSVTSIGEKAFVGCTGLTQVTIPSSVTSIGKQAFFLCEGLTEVIIPSSVKNVGLGAFSSRPDKPILIAIDALNEQEYQKFSRILQFNFNHTIPYGLYLEVKQARKDALRSIVKPIGIGSFPKNCPEEVILLIQQFTQQWEGRLHDIIHQVPVPRQTEKLQSYKQALQKALNQFREKQGHLDQRLDAINKLHQTIQRTQEAIAKKKRGFFDSFENQLKLKESHARVAIATKLIEWLGGNSIISFTEEEIALLSESNSSVSLILNNCAIELDKLPKTPLSRDHGSGMKEP